MATWDELETLRKLSQPTVGQRIASGLQAAGQGMMGQTYTPPPQDTFVKDLLKAAVLAKIKQKEQSPYLTGETPLPTGYEYGIGKKGERTIQPIKTAKPTEVRNQIRDVMAGLTPVDNLSQEISRQIIPNTLPAAGGYIPFPIGSTIANEQITSPTGENLGEYSPGYEPQPLPITVIPEYLRQQMGINQKQAMAKSLGMPIAKEEKGITPLQALNIITDPFKSRELKKKYPKRYEEIKAIAEGNSVSTIPQPILESMAEGNVSDINW